MEKKQENIDNNKIKFYVTDEVLKILFDFLSQEKRIDRLKQEIKEITEGVGSNNHKTQHPEEYFNIINEKITNVEKIINKNYNTLQDEDKTALAEFLYQLEDLGEDKQFYPEQEKQENHMFKLNDIITQLHAIKTLTLPVLEDCTYHYDRNNASKTTKINLVQDFNFLQQTTKSKYSFTNFYPFNKFKTEQEAIKFHYEIMAKNYFTYLKDCINANPNKFFVCYKPGVNCFGDHTPDIVEIFKKEFNLLDDKYKQRLLFNINDTCIDNYKKNGFKYDYTVNDLRKMYPENEFLKTIQDTDIAYINGVARDPWAKIGDEGRMFANNKCCSRSGSTDKRFVQSSNEVKILYGVEIKKGQPKDKRKLQNLNAQKPKIICKDINYKNIQNKNQLSQTDDMYKDKEEICCCNIF